jgi:hypothetical protein
MGRLYQNGWGVGADWFTVGQFRALVSMDGNLMGSEVLTAVARVLSHCVDR